MTFFPTDSAGSVIQRNVIPGLHSLRSLTRGYLLPPLRGSLTRTSALTLLFNFALSDTPHPTN
jgi:hypothetical protein